jgi:hypothetical protein
MNENLRFDAVLAQITSLGRHKSCIFARYFDRFQARGDSDPAASMSQRLLAWLMRLSRTSAPGADPATVVDCSGGCVFALEVREDLLNHNQIFDACDDLDVAAAALADVDIEHALEALRPG